jgi:hypothetical protein
MNSLHFDWNPNSNKSVETKVVPRANGSTDNVLRVDFVNNRDPVAPIFQSLRLAPGKYIYSGESKTEDLKTESGLVWRIWCLEGNEALLATSPRFSGTNQWDHFEVRFEVPSNCTTQRLALRMMSPAVLDQQISGYAYYDNLNITPLAASR